MKLIEKSLELRQGLRRLALGFFRPSVLETERCRNLLNDNLKQHWDPIPIEVHELIHEEWEDPKKTAAVANNGHSDNFIVFIDPELDIDWVSDRNTTETQLQAISFAESVAARRCNHLPREQLLEFKRLIGQAVVNAIRSDAKQSRALAEQAAQFLKDRTTERSRFWTLNSSHAFLLAIGAIVASVMTAPAAYKLCSSAPAGFWPALAGGFIGAYLSVIQKASSGHWDAASGLDIHILEVLTKLIAGTMFGGIVFAIARSVHAPASLKSLAPDDASLFVFALAAGFIERLIPKMISTYSQSFANQEPNQPHDPKSNSH